MKTKEFYSAIKRLGFKYDPEYRSGVGRYIYMLDSNYIYVTGNRDLLISCNDFENWFNKGNEKAAIEYIRENKKHINDAKFDTDANKYIKKYENYPSTKEELWSELLDEIVKCLKDINRIVESCNNENATNGPNRYWIDNSEVVFNKIQDYYFEMKTDCWDDSVSFFEFEVNCNKVNAFIKKVKRFTSTFDKRSKINVTLLNDFTGNGIDYYFNQETFNRGDN